MGINDQRTWKIQFFFNLHSISIRSVPQQAGHGTSPRRVHLHSNPVFIRSHVLISLIAQPADRVIRALGYSTIRRNNSLISRQQAKGVDVAGAPVRVASRRIYSVVTAVETMKFNAANLHANPHDVNPAPVYLAPGCV